MRPPSRGAALAAMLLLAACGGSRTAGRGRTEPPRTAHGPQATPGANRSGGSTEGPGPFRWTGNPGRDGSLRTVKVAGREVARLDTPTMLVARPGDPRHLWAAERAGRVRRLVRSGSSLRLEAPVQLDLTADTTTDGEHGLLGMTFSGDGNTLYVSHTNKAGDSRLASYRMRGGSIDRQSRVELLAVDQPFPNHNGGNVVLGPDGKLWFGLGDGGAADDPDNRAQNPTDLLGKILRLDPAKGFKPEIVITGVRNPWRFAFDPANGDLWIGDVGQNAVEEVDHLPAGQIDGKNLGWSGFEGSVSYLEGSGRRPALSVPPIFEYRHPEGCSITGGFVYRGREIPDLQGAYVFADYCAGVVRALRLGADGQVSDERSLHITVDSPISFAEDDHRELYVLSQAGPVVRLVPA
ncbi:MAG: hypothetical protein JWM05_3043 [Acidimicrobiales bacterium]|nr:hypothetical protein [Acidimicrobiales bacterium]